MATFYWMTGSMSMASTVGLEAIRAHSGGLSDENKKKLKMAIRFQAINSLALMLLSQKDSEHRHFAGLPLLAGTVMFSGALYHSVMKGGDASNSFSKMMPYGGMSMIAGYTLMALI